MVGGNSKKRLVTVLNNVATTASDLPPFYPLFGLMAIPCFLLREVLAAFYMHTRSTNHGRFYPRWPQPTALLPLGLLEGGSSKTIAGPSRLGQARLERSMSDGVLQLGTLPPRIFHGSIHKGYGRRNPSGE